MCQFSTTTEFILSVFFSDALVSSSSVFSKIFNLFTPFLLQTRMWNIHHFHIPRYALISIPHSKGIWSSEVLQYIHPAYDLSEPRWRTIGSGCFMLRVVLSIICSRLISLVPGFNKWFPCKLGQDHQQKKVIPEKKYCYYEHHGLTWINNNINLVWWKCHLVAPYKM